MKTPSLDPRALLTFRSVAHHGSFSSAARELGWSQPALSQQVRKLEIQLGAPLLERSSRGIALTEAGRLLLSHADALHVRLQRANSELSLLMSEKSRRVTVAAFPSACTSIVAPVMSYFMAAEESSRIDLSLVQREPSEVLDSLLTGEFDLALVFRFQFEDAAWSHDGVTFEVLGQEPLMLLAPNSHRAAAKPSTVACNLEDFAEERWVSGCSLCRHNLLQATERAGFTPKIQHSTDDSRVVQELVSRGQCVALVPYLSLLGERYPGTVARPLADPSCRELLLLRRSETTSVEVEQVAERLRDREVQALGSAVASG